MADQDPGREARLKTAASRLEVLAGYIAQLPCDELVRATDITLEHLMERASRPGGQHAESQIDAVTKRRNVFYAAVNLGEIARAAGMVP